MEQKKGEMRATKKNEWDEYACRFIYEKSGVLLESVWDLVNTKEDYSRIIPTLVDALYLNLQDDGRTFEGLARALSLKEAKGIASQALIKIFRKMKTPSQMWAVSNALAVTWTKKDVDEILSLWKDRSFGSGRQMLAIPLGKSKDARAFDALVSQLDDVSVQAHAVWGLSILNDPRAEPFFLKLLKSDSELVRKNAKKGLEKFAKISKSKK